MTTQSKNSYTLTQWLIWTVPALSILFAAYLFYSEFGNRGPLIEISFTDGSGLEAQKTPIVCRGVKIGFVESVELHPELDEVLVHARLDKSVEELAQENSSFWIVRPNISLEGVSGLDTLVSGAYIAVSPGEGSLARSFQGLKKPPIEAGKNAQYSLRAAAADSVHEGVPITFRGLVVGKVLSVELSAKASDVIIQIAIHPAYQGLIRQGVVFWNDSGVNMKVGLLGAQLKTGSLQSLLSGSISMAFPPEAAEAERVPQGSEFPLYPQAEKRWKEWLAIDADAGEADTSQ